jgi:hypothetical protein
MDMLDAQGRANHGQMMPNLLSVCIASNCPAFRTISLAMAL